MALRFQKFPTLLDYQEYAWPLHRLTPFACSQRPPEIKLSVRVLHVGAMFLMLQGRRRAALEILASLYHLGQLMNQNNTLTCRLIGMDFRSLALEGLKLYALNCCQTAHQFIDLWTMLKQLNQAEQEPSLEQLFSMEPPLRFLLPSTGIKPLPASCSIGDRGPTLSCATVHTSPYHPARQLMN